jgi:antitoxin ParD1/3/4
MPTRNVVITDHQSRLIDELVESGRYQNASEVLREGIRLIEEREQERARKLEALRAAAREGIASMERGDFVTFSDAKSLNAHFRQLTDKAIKRRKAR